MFTKSRLIRFCIFFIIYISINLLIAKLRNNGSIYVKILNTLRNTKNPSYRNEFYFDIKNEINYANLSSTVKVKALFALEKEQNEKIIKQIVETCKENNLTTSMIKQNFEYSPKHHGLYCKIRKVESTKFMKLLFNIDYDMDTDADDSRNIYIRSRKIASKNDILIQKLTTDPSVFKLLIIRHPFERLVSAYRDRIEDHSKYTQESHTYIPKIFNLTRPELFKFELIDNSVIKRFNENKRFKLVPSFSEFVQWILQQEQDKDDPHWNQYYKHCALCSIHYDHILKLDNYTNNEINYIFTRMNIFQTKESLFKIEQKNSSHINFEITCNYFKNLTHEAVVNLYEKYKIDFDMFNYEFDKYFECTDGD